MGSGKIKGAVAAGHPVTAAAAAEVLRDGGNAFDAAIAGLFAATVPEVVLASLGGGGFLMARLGATGETRLYDFFVDTPGRRRPVSDIDFRSIVVDFGPQSQEFHIGAGATAVPGFVPGLFAVHRDLAALPMTRLLEPAVRVARDGVRMSAYQSYLFSIIPPILSLDPRAAKCFAPGGRLLKAGDRLVNRQLADTLEALGREGERLFIDGEIGQAIQKQAAERGGHLTLDDLEGYRVAVRKPLCVSYQGRRVSLNPAPSAGGPLLGFSLSLLDQLPGDDRMAPQWLARVMQRTNDVRASSCDIEVALGDASLLQTHLDEMRGRFQAVRGTTHISVIDCEGNAAAATVSNGEGNGIMVDDFGFMLNNMLGEEDLNPGGFDGWQPGQRMASMMAPTLVEAQDGGQAALGSGGSNRIRSAVLQVLLQLIDRGASVEQAVRAPRLHVEKCGGLSFEAQFPEAVQQALMNDFAEARVWPQPNMFFGGVNVALCDGDGQFFAAADPRRQGDALIVSSSMPTEGLER